MVKIEDSLTMRVGFTMAMGALGCLGGHTLKVIIPGISPMAYGVTLGLWFPVGLTLYKIAEEVNKKGGTINIIFGVIGGYFVSWTAANLLGFSVKLIAPFIGVGVLAAVVGLVTVMAAPVFQVAFKWKK